MFHAPYGGSRPHESTVLQYWAVFLQEGKKPIALFEKHDVAVMFREAMTDGQCTIRPYAFRPELESYGTTRLS
jgi:hypothetical protein